MPPPIRRRLVLVLAVIALAACSKEKRDGEPRMPADEPQAAEHATGVSAAEADRAMRAPATAADLPAPGPAPTAFACEGGVKVELGYLVAKVTLPDGSTAQIARDPGDAAHFGDDSLAFRTRDGAGELSRGGRTLPCAAD
ncbi:hypothetical protein [Cognatilysobacter segetis]|uniref:hypothetical protein n=1 Tax=Cognatilysobacter segetis TaxID=2492394 RepID=UPI00105E3BED|nr:hypothetical protein [Lysobacter segetis]